jgi:hypothetical protein
MSNGQTEADKFLQNQISYEDNGTIYSIGYGPEAAERTFTIHRAVPTSATSTPSSL